MLILLARGYTNREIAHELVISAKTASVHVSHILQKLNATNRREAAAAFFVGVFPANVQMAVDWRHRPAPLRTAALSRLPLQVPLVRWARGVARNEEGRS